MAIDSKKQFVTKRLNNPPHIAPVRRRKLTDEQVALIVERYQSKNASQIDLAREHGVTAQAISAIFCGISYAWLTRIGIDAPLKGIRALNNRNKSEFHHETG